MSGMYRHCNSQVIDVAERVIQTIKQIDNELYYKTLWSNIKKSLEICRHNLFSET